MRIPPPMGIDPGAPDCKRDPTAIFRMVSQGCVVRFRLHHKLALTSFYQSETDAHECGAFAGGRAALIRERQSLCE